MELTTDSKLFGCQALWNHRFLLDFCSTDWATRLNPVETAVGPEIQIS
jgi:hypothetical protein